MRLVKDLPGEGLIAEFNGVVTTYKSMRKRPDTGELFGCHSQDLGCDETWDAQRVQQCVSVGLMRRAEFR